MTKKSLSEEDQALFRDAMRSVTPLKEKKLKIERSVSEEKTLKTKKSPAHPAPPLQQNLSDFISDPVQSNAALSYAVPGMPAKRLRALKNGLIPWEAKLDLHGLYADHAKDALIQFIKKQSHHNKRCLLVIHGKGGHKGNAPVIKNLVNRWLPQFPDVLAFHSAQAKDGGNGAVYVLLKKTKLEFISQTEGR